MAKRALVTGGTSGIGAAFARQLAAEDYDLVLVARDVDRLEAMARELKSNSSIDIEVLVADLATEAGLIRTEERLRSLDSPIDFLVNNAGFGLKGSFLDTPVADQERMLDVNVRAVLRLTHAALGTMVERRSGDILNVSSVAGYITSFRPSSTYAATKAFVTAFTEGLAQSLGGTGVRISAVCPGFVRTEFHDRAGIKMSKMPGFMWLDAAWVVRTALGDHRSGRVISIPSFQYKAVVAANRVVPPSIAHRLTRLVSKLTH